MIKQVLFVGFGGALGSVLRFLTSTLTAKYYSGSFPFATFAVNITGCFLIGIFMGAFGQDNLANQNVRFFFATGFCGGYTTFSAFAFENLNLLRDNSPWPAISYVAMSVLAGLAAVWLGAAVAKQIG